MVKLQNTLHVSVTKSKIELPPCMTNPAFFILCTPAQICHLFPAKTVTQRKQVCGAKGFWQYV